MKKCVKMNKWVRIGLLVCSLSTVSLQLHINNSNDEFDDFSSHEIHIQR